MDLSPAFILLAYSARLVISPAGSFDDSNRISLAISSWEEKNGMVRDAWKYQPATCHVVGLINSITARLCH